MRFIRWFLKRFLLILTLTTCTSQLIGLLAPVISPGFSLVPAFFGLAFPYLAVVNIVLLCIWLWRLKWYLFFPLAVLVVSWNQLTLNLQFNFSSAKNPEKQIELMTHNIRAFGLNGPHFETKTGKKLFRFYRSTDADIYCFQEFMNTSHADFYPLDSMEQALDCNYKHIEYTVHFRKNDFGMATFSKFPIINKGMVPIKQQGTNMCIFTDIDWNGQPVRIYNMHLASTHMRDEEHDYFNTLADKSNDERVKGATNIITLLGNAFKRRAGQAEMIASHIRESLYPVIVCGDFNDTPNSYAYHVISGNLIDAFTERGIGLGKTYNGKLPSFRIDFVLKPKEFKTLDYRTMKENLSDHFPVAATLTE